MMLNTEAAEADASLLLTVLFTNEHVAICVVLVLVAAVGAVGIPVSAGDAIGAREVSVGCT